MEMPIGAVRCGMVWPISHLFSREGRHISLLQIVFYLPGPAEIGGGWWMGWGGGSHSLYSFKCKQ